MKTKMKKIVGALTIAGFLMASGAAYAAETEECGAMCKIKNAATSVKCSVKSTISSIKCKKDAECKEKCSADKAACKAK
jgi:hypothetical protein